MILKTDQKAQEDFLKEIKLLKHVSLDANVVQYFGASFQHDQLWLVTEYMEVSHSPIGTWPPPCAPLSDWNAKSCVECQSR